MAQVPRQRLGAGERHFYQHVHVLRALNAVAQHAAGEDVAGQGAPQLAEGLDVVAFGTLVKAPGASFIKTI